MFFLLFATACFTLDIETALAEAAASISKDLKHGSTISIVCISSDSEKMSNFMLDEIAFQFLKLRKLTVADRKSLNALKKEMEFKLSDELSDETIQKIGAITGANTILSGSFENMGSYYMLTLKAFDVSSGTFQSGYRQKVNANETTQMLLANTAVKTTKRKSDLGFGSYSHRQRFAIGMKNYFAFGLGSYQAGYTGDGIGLTVTHVVGLSLFWGGIGGIILAEKSSTLKIEADIANIIGDTEEYKRLKNKTSHAIGDVDIGVTAMSLGICIEFGAFLYGCIAPVWYDPQYSKIGEVLKNFKFDLVADSRGSIVPCLSYRMEY